MLQNALLFSSLFLPAIEKDAMVMDALRRSAQKQINMSQEALFIPYFLENTDDL